MMHHGQTWQGVLAAMGTSYLTVIACMILTLVSGYLNWWIVFTSSFLVIGFFYIVRVIPIALNLSRSYFRWIIVLFFVHILVTIISFALHYRSTGLIGAIGPFKPGFRDAMYFSVTTFTTLGYGDFQPLPEMRLATSIEAIAGMFSVALTTAVIFLWCQDHMVPYHMAFFDGNRRHKKRLGISRVRIRTITGKERSLPDWVLPPEEGEVLYYDERRGEWLPVTDDTELPENALVVSAAIDDEET